jgi:hypothetical protein
LCFDTRGITWVHPGGSAIRIRIILALIMPHSERVLADVFLVLFLCQINVVDTDVDVDVDVDSIFEYIVGGAARAEKSRRICIRCRK